jgi:hypothetical protein
VRCIASFLLLMMIVALHLMFAKALATPEAVIMPRLGVKQAWLATKWISMLLRLILGML